MRQKFCELTKSQIILRFTLNIIYLAGHFEIPNDFSTGVAELIKHMLTVDTQQRAKTSDILKNSWFRVDLPAYLFVPLTKKISYAAVDGHAIEEASEVSLGMKSLQCNRRSQ